MKNIKTYITYIFFLLSINSFGQKMSVIYGVITDSAGYSVCFATVAIPGTKYGITADKFGQYELQIPVDSNKIVISCVGYQTITSLVKAEAGKRVNANFVLPVAYENLEEIQIKGRTLTTGTMQRIDTRTLTKAPNISGNIESVIKNLPGVSSNNELSSQYSVRGGSFDENLVYVNEVEVYRPFLIRSGQQEGLSFINPDLVGSLKFSAGGFDACYGDKMSSVLDITYKRPEENTGSFTASMLGANAHYEGISKNKKFRHLTGIRYKTSQYLLTSLDTKGEYVPSFTDIQTYLTYDISPKLEAGFLGNFSQNKYNFIPSDRTTNFGTFQDPLQLKVYYEGRENDLFSNSFGAFSLNFHRENKVSLKLIASAYNTVESETFDILGQYFINQLDKTSDNESDTSINIGIGSSLNHARNYFDAEIVALSHIGTLSFNANKIKWGFTFQQENISDRLNEWTLIDSAGYALPYDTGIITLSNASHSRNNLVSNRLIGYVMNTIEFSPGNDKLYFTAGLRVHHWSLNNQTIFNPRFSISYMPEWRKNLVIYFATGFYNQPAFYKEMRNPQGIVNTNLKAQKSVHYVLGSNYIFYALTKPFKITAEVYYKKYDYLVPYRVDNVRTIYAGQNLAVGYAAGIDLKINGEFVKGTESWFSLSLLRTMEDIKNDSYIMGTDTIIYPGYYPRPTDQLLNLGMYFQDYLPRWPSYKVYLSIHYGSKLPVSIPMGKRWDEVYRILPSYKRVDVGFSKMLKGSGDVLSGSFFNNFKEIWFSAEIFNVIGINNTASYLWVKTVSNMDKIPGYFAVPNYLTSRRFNVKLTATF